MELFEIQLKQDKIQYLQAMYCGSNFEVTIKPYDEFDKSDFYLYVLQDMLSDLRNYNGLFEEHKCKGEALLQAFLYCSTLNTVYLQDNKIKFCCSLLHQFIYLKDQYVAFSSLSNFVHNAFKIDSQLFTDKQSDLIEVRIY